MRHIESTFDAPDGLTLYRQSWLAEGDPRAVVVLVHGVGEHSGRYLNVAVPLADAGFSVATYDHRGHGRSEGTRVYVDRWSCYTDDLRRFLSVVSAENPGAPVVIYGHSMGSLVTLDELETDGDGFAGAIISGVATEPAGVGSPALIAVAKVLSVIAPRFSVDLGIKPEQLTRDPAAVEAAHSDPDLTGRATARWGAEGVAAVERIKAKLDLIDLPMLILHGERDPLNKVEGALHLADAVGRADTRVIVYPDMLHEPHNELGHERVAADVVSWMTWLTEPVSA